MPEINLSGNQQKATVYRLLSACFYQPEDRFVAEDLFGQLVNALNSSEPELEDLAKSMKVAFCQPGTEKLLGDYSRLFLGPFEIPAKPYGSVYLDGEKVVMGDSTMKVKACYRDAGFDVAEDFREMPDHIAVELEFLYLLSFRQNEALALDDSETVKRWQEFEQNFLQNHLGLWVEDFCRRICDHAETDFYRLLAELTDKFVRQQKV